MIEQHPENLSKLQHTFKKLVWEGSLKNPKESPEYLKETAPINWKTRVGVYQYAVKERILESLEDDFEEVKKVMGEKEFRKAMEAYLAVYPSKYSSLAEVSKDVPEFLKEYSETASRKFLSELADLEWKLIKTSLTENTILNNLSELGFDENQGKELVFLLHDSVGLVCYDHPVHLFFEGSVKSVKEQITRLVLYQEKKSGHYEEVEKLEYDLLLELQNKKSLTEINSFLIESNIATEKLGEYFTKWSSCGWISGFIQAVNTKIS